MIRTLNATSYLYLSYPWVPVLPKVEGTFIPVGTRGNYPWFSYLTGNYLLGSGKDFGFSRGTTTRRQEPVPILKCNSHYVAPLKCIHCRCTFARTLTLAWIELSISETVSVGHSGVSNCLIRIRILSHRSAEQFESEDTR